ncbi:MAG: TauD/TfdA family dioxygenase [Oleiphilaceae bacterium]|nr:TauD/TfdA family dioxygenase [Oleiphilaceae bacterium]
MSQQAFVLDQLHGEDTHDFVTTYTPAGDNSLATLKGILQQNKVYFREKIAQRGVLLFRGFATGSHQDFHDLVENGMELEPWNAFNVKRMPGFITSWLRQYSENLVGGGDYRRYIDRDTVRLGPVESAIQGPHTEGGIRSERSRYIALCCFEPAPYRAETGMADLHRAYQNLPKALREKYDRAWNRFYYCSARRLNWFDRFMLTLSPFQVIDRPDGRSNLALPPCPSVCTVPETGRICLQPWAFARNTNPQVHRAAVEVFRDRGELKPDSTAENMSLTWELCDQQGQPMEWTEEEQKTLFATIYREALLMEWQKGDIAFVDNVRIGHWRMNGEQGERKLVQIQATNFNAEPYHPSKVEGAIA